MKFHEDTLNGFKVIVKRPESIEAFNLTSRYMYLDDLLYIDSPYFEGMINRIYPHEL